MTKIFKIKFNKGFTLIELLIGVAIFSMVALAIYQGYAKTVEGSAALRVKSAAIDLANEQFEIAHNLPFASVGLIEGVPSGVLSRFQTLKRNNIDFLVTTTIRNVDDPFDGQIGSTTNDLSPADYKFMEVEISCATCKNFQPLVYSTHVSPKNLEAASTNGSLFINVFDGNGLPVSEADVHIENNLLLPSINIDETTNINGQVQIVDTKPSIESYEITVSKDGFSTDKTYTPDAPANPNPIKPHSTVALQQLTKISFAIDKVSRLELSAVDSACNPISSVPVTITGAKTIGDSPIIHKFSNSYTTDSSGFLGLDNIEWDNYSFDFSSSNYDLIGTNPVWPVFVSPNSVVDINAVLATKNPNRLVVTVKDNVTGLAVTDAKVTLMSGATVLGEKISGRGFLAQTDWLGGDGQINYTDPSMFYSASGDIDYSTNGEIKLAEVLGSYPSEGVLESSTFDTQIFPQYNQILWESSVDSSSTTVRMQLAFATTSTATTTWNFVGPDGTENTYFTPGDQNIFSSASNKRYFRYKAFLNTIDENLTPILNDVYVTYNFSCTPSGQVSFGGLNLGTYSVTVEKTGYQTLIQDVVLSSTWQETVFNLLKE